MDNSYYCTYRCMQSQEENFKVTPLPCDHIRTIWGIQGIYVVVKVVVVVKETVI